MTRILVVEDETIVAMDIASTLRNLGYEVVGTAETGAAAIEMAFSAEPDLILMDIRIKGPMDGIEAADAIRQKKPIPVVFLTAHADIDTVERAKGAAPYGYLVKPFEEGALHRVMEIALRRVRTEKGERKEDLDALWQSEERFRLLVDAVADYAIIMVDLSDQIASWNAGAERMTGFRADEVIGQAMAMLRPVQESDPPRLADDVPTQWEGVAVKKDGSRYTAQMYAAPMQDRTGTLIGYATIFRDVTQERKTHAQLMEAQRFEALGELAGGIAHDFNNMLMVILTRCDILLRQLEPEKQKNYVADIRTAALKNRDLTQQLLAAARRQVLEPKVTNLNEVILSALRLLAPTLEENIKVRTELEQELWTVFVDTGKLHQVLMNLAINARDAMPQGGSLIIESRNVHVDAFYARQHVGIREGDYVSLVVSDTGTGIPEAIRERIFDPFFTTKAAGQGTGLGLAVVRGIVEQNGGRIWMYSEEGRGTTFKIFLPRHAGGEQPQEEPPDVAERGQETILLVEDEELLRSVLREALEEHGYQVLDAANPRQALDISRTFPGTIDLLLTDIIMPDMTGIALAERITATRPQTKAIYMSGYTNHAVVNVSALPAAVHFLEKPIATNVLLRIIRSTLQKK